MKPPTLRLQIGAACVAALAACATHEGDRSPGAFGRVGASIAVIDDGTRVAVVDPDQGSVSVLDAGSLDPVARIDVGGEPHALLPLEGGALVVASYRGGEIVVVDPDAGVVRARRHVCNGARGLAASPDGARIFVACEWEGRVVAVDPASLDAVEIASGLARPWAVAASASRVLVAERTSGRVVAIAEGGERTSIALTPTEAPYRPALAKMTANLASAIVPGPDGRVFVTHELVNHTGETSLERVEDDYGSITDGNPKINPALTTLDASRDVPATTADPVVYARFDGGARAFDGPSAAAPFGERALLVAHVSSANVAVVDTRAATPDARAVVLSFATGAGPSGVAVDEARSVAYVDNALDASVSKLDLSAIGREGGVTPAILTRTRPLPARYSARALAGRKAFYDATNPHLTPSGVVACSTCHPEGGDDGLVWFVHTSHIPAKRRRTPHLANARSSTAPFHWDGEFATMDDLVRGTVRDLMAGDALLIDGGAVQAYLDEIVHAPVPPPGDAAAIARGEALFRSPRTGCATCHAGPDFTDGLRHDVLDPSSGDRDAVLASANTPGLRGLFLRAPYFHDGRAATLRDVLGRADAPRHGSTSDLSTSERDDLVAFLGSL